MTGPEGTPPPDRQPGRRVLTRIGPAGADQHLRDLMGPLAVDQQIRGAAIQCWQMLRPEDRSVEAVEQIILGVMRRVLDDLKEDAATFGFTLDAAAEDEE